MKRLATLARCVFALLGAARVASAARMQVPTNVLMGVYQDRPAPGCLVTYLEAIFGADPRNKKAGQTLQAVLDLNFEDLYLLDGKASARGLDCVEEKACSLAPGPRASCRYQGLQPIDCSPAETLLRFYPVALADPSVARLQFKLFNATAEWRDGLGPRSVLGLHRSSPFWDYIRDAFDEGQFEFSLVYQLADRADSLLPDASRLADSFWIVNGRFEVNDPVMQTQDAVLDSGPWTFKDTAVNFSAGAEGPSLAGTACIDNTVNAFVLLADPLPVAQAVFRRLCGSAEGCDKKNSNLKKLQAWTVSYSGASARGKKQASDRVRIDPEDFVNFLDNGTAVLGLAPLNSSSSCAGRRLPEPVFGLGRLFLSKAEFIIRYNTSAEANQPANFSIGFNKLTYPDDTIFLIILFVLAVLIVILVVVIALARVLNRNKQGSIETVEDSYKHPSDS